jgi:hypothetical protein
VKVIDARDQKGFDAFGNTEPKVHPRDLPPPPPPFGTGKRINPDGSITTSDEAIPAETQRKLDKSNLRRFLGLEPEEEGE